VCWGYIHLFSSFAYTYLNHDLKCLKEQCLRFFSRWTRDELADVLGSSGDKSQTLQLCHASASCGLFQAYIWEKP
jgi:hypothetical protein